MKDKRTGSILSPYLLVDDGPEQLLERQAKKDTFQVVVVFAAAVGLRLRTMLVFFRSSGSPPASLASTYTL